MLLRIHHQQMVQLHVQVLVHRMQRTTQRQVVLELHHDGLTDEGLEEMEELLREGTGGRTRGEGRGKGVRQGVRSEEEEGDEEGVRGEA